MYYVLHVLCTVCTMYCMYYVLYVLCTVCTMYYVLYVLSYVLYVLCTVCTMTCMYYVPLYHCMIAYSWCSINPIFRSENVADNNADAKQHPVRVNIGSVKPTAKIAFAQLVSV